MKRSRREVFMHLPTLAQRSNPLRFFLLYDSSRATACRIDWRMRVSVPTQKHFVQMEPLTNGISGNLHEHPISLDVNGSKEIVTFNRVQWDSHRDIIGVTGC